MGAMGIGHICIARYTMHIKTYVQKAKFQGGQKIWQRAQISVEKLCIKWSGRRLLCGVHYTPAWCAMFTSAYAPWIRSVHIKCGVCMQLHIYLHTQHSTPNLLSNPGVIRNIREVFHGISFWLQVITCFVNTINTGVMQPCKIYSYYKSPAHNWGKEKTRVRHNTETKFGPNNQKFGRKIWFRWQKNETLVWFFPHFTSSQHKIHPPHPV